MRGTTRHAFTLVDLLVSLAVIGVLMVVLMPCLHRARDEGRRAVCLAHLHSIAGVWIAALVERGIPAIADWDVRIPGQPDARWNLADQWEMDVSPGTAWICPADPDWRDGTQPAASICYNWGREIAREKWRARRMLIEEDGFVNDKPVFCDGGQWHNGFTARAWMDGRAVTKWE